MTTFLLDGNVLIARLDPAHEWFGAHGHKAWATCPLTENGVLRIVGHTRYLNSPGKTERIDATRLLTTAQVTDSYRLALACAHDGQLTSFDRRLVTDAVRGGARRLRLIRSPAW